MDGRSAAQVFALLMLLWSGGLISFFNTEPTLMARDARIERRGTQVLFHSQPFTGRLEEHYENGQLLRRLQYVDGFLEGRYERFGLSGRRIEMGVYRHNQLEGVQLGWYEEGPKRYRFNFKNGQREGLQTQWHLNGNLFRQETLARGELSQKKIFYSNGDVFTNFAQRDGRIYGLDGGALCMENRTTDK